METIELRIALTEEIVRELLWQALAPEALVITNGLNDAIAQQQAIRGVALDEYMLSGISITVAQATMHEEPLYTPAQAGRLIA